MFSIPNGGCMEVTGVVVDGIMYVTVANECYALDAGSGREIWHYQRARDGITGLNRGAGVAGHRRFIGRKGAPHLLLKPLPCKYLWGPENRTQRGDVICARPPA